MLTKGTKCIMTQEEIDAAVMRNVHDHVANENAISCLLSRVRRAQNALRAINLERDDFDPKTLAQPIMDLRDTDLRTDLKRLRIALQKRRELRSFLKMQGLDTTSL